MQQFLKSKIHNAWITEANIDYIGSISIDKDLLDIANLQEFERVLVVSKTSGARLETYVIEGEAGSGEICMNGAASHLITAGEEVIIMAFEITWKQTKPKLILVDKNNKFDRYL